ncbi:MAG: type II toxin-antitoxin system death-on-curing family toxin [Desulfarculales bacterium]|jgi:death-on-curing protein|nr:type II toxin-antitoxin system death-on-curing family toxin [Desulfarculales bacterium]
MRKYLTVQDILGFHHILLKRYGGRPGVRDLGAIEAAAFRPQSGYYADITEETAALMESLLINHPFVDGNKRAAFAACDVFLRINGYSLQTDTKWLYARMLAWIQLQDNRWQQITEDLKERIIKL